MKIEAKFTYDKVNHAEENEIHAVVTLKAPKIDWEKERAPICIISAYLLHSSTCRVSITSVIVAMSNSFPTSAKYFRPSSPSP